MAKQLGTPTREALVSACRIVDKRLRTADPETAREVLPKRVVYMAGPVPNPWRSPLLEVATGAFDEGKFVAQDFCGAPDGVSLADPRERSLGGSRSAGPQRRPALSRSGPHPKTIDQ